ncbi:beta-galactosidase [Schaalia sp. lx-100]|uniref:beta-galactosidase n=1 Tax=Schaalia sp. lx-100 TaxID=2899081 RepID=UPI001E3A0C62|nr:beta-galactosidase [Schaalia sp. lx-100]MCD4557294.1 beta-galactosidase [Schaalia sp. lx-100]
MIPTLRTPAYGGDWSPEQWDEATIDQDIHLMGEAGVTMISLGIFSWAFLEPTEKHYDFDWLASIIDRLHAAGIAVDLASGTASPPAWMAHTYPQTLPVDKRGVRLGFGSRQQYCPSSPIYRAAARGLVQRLAQRFGDHPAVALWHIGNEYGCHTAQCYCDICADAFRVWLRNRYSNLTELNEVWGTAFWSQRYTAYEQITPPREMPTFHNPAQDLDWKRFCQENLLSLMRMEKEAIREYSDRPVTTNFMGDFSSLDYAQWAKYLDVISDDSYPDPADPAAAHTAAWTADIMRGLKAGKPWLLMEQAPSAVQWRERNSPKRPGQFTLWSVAKMAHGADGILQFQWRQSVRGSETFHSGMVPHSGKKSRTWHEVVRTGEVIQRLAPVMGSSYEAQVAVVMDWPSQWAKESAIGPVSDAPFERTRAWHRTLWEAGIATDVIPVDADFRKYRLIIVPELFIDYPDCAQRLREAAQQGAHVIVEGPSGVVDEHMKAVTGGYLGSLRELVGVAVSDHAALTGEVISPSSASNSRGDAVNRLSRAVGVPSACTWAGLSVVSEPLRRCLERIGSPAPDMRCGMWAEEIMPYRGDAWQKTTDIDIIAVFDGRGGGADLSGMPAITRHLCGQGAAWYIACDVDALSRYAIATLVCAYARVRPVMADLPDGVEAQRRGPYLFLLNHSDKSVELRGIIGTDLVDQQECRGHVMLAPRSAMVVDTGGHAALESTAKGKQ